MDIKLHRAYRHSENPREIPQHDGKGSQRRELLQKADEQPERQSDKLVNVFLYALVGVVHVAAHDLQSVIRRAIEPRPHIFSREPCAPAQLKELAQINRVHGDDDMQEREAREFADKRPKRRVVIFLKHIVELVVPAVNQHQQVNRSEIESDDHAQQPDSAFLFLGHPIALENFPELR